jgi:hypothetical protein
MYNKSKFGFILRKCLNQKHYDWKDTSESLKDGKLTTYLFLKTNFKLEEKYLTLVKNCSEFGNFVITLISSSIS